MGRNRKSYSEAFKEKAVFEILKNGRKQEEIAAEFSISPSTLSEWKNEFLTRNYRKELKEAEKKIQELEQQKEVLAQSLGMANLEIEFLKKKHAISERKKK